MLANHSKVFQMEFIFLYKKIKSFCDAPIQLGSFHIVTQDLVVVQLQIHNKP